METTRKNAKNSMKSNAGCWSAKWNHPAFGIQLTMWTTDSLSDQEEDIIMTDNTLSFLDSVHTIDSIRKYCILESCRSHKSSMRR